jgi:hypothetical protein
MVIRFGKWWSLWAALIVVWTLVAFAFAWINLPRAETVPHDPQFLTRLSEDAASILHRADTTSKPRRGALVWSESSRFVRMSNGTDLTLPAYTTRDQAALVASEYHRLLDNEARGRRWSFLLGMLALWLVPCGGLLAVLLAARPLRDVMTPFASRVQVISHYVRQRTEKTAPDGDTVIYAEAAETLQQRAPRRRRPGLPVRRSAAIRPTLHHVAGFANGADRQPT